MSRVKSIVKSKFYKMRNIPNVLDGADIYTLIDDSKIECLDRNTMIIFWGCYFQSGQPLKIKGEWRLTHLPPKFDLTLFQFEGIVATKPVANVLEQLAPKDIQRFSMEAAGDHNRFEMINVTKAVNCLDLERSDICFHPIKTEEPMAIRRMVLKRGPIGKCNIFRLANYLPTAIVSEEFRNRLTGEVDTTGTIFEEVETVD